MKKITRHTVGEFARALITLNGATTTLEVKEALRKQHYFATQNQVREYMLDITSNDGDIEYTDNGTHRIYAFKSTDDIVDSIYSDGKLTNQISFDDGGWVDIINNNGCVTVTPQSYKFPICDSITVAPDSVNLNSDDVPSDYWVSNTNGTNKIFYRNVSRGQAKHLWSKATGNPYHCARTSKTL